MTVYPSVRQLRWHNHHPSSSTRKTKAASGAVAPECRMSCAEISCSHHASATTTTLPPKNKHETTTYHHTKLFTHTTAHPQLEPHVFFHFFMIQHTRLNMYFFVHSDVEPPHPPHTQCPAARTDCLLGDRATLWCHPRQLFETAVPLQYAPYSPASITPRDAPPPFFPSTPAFLGAQNVWYL